MKVKGEELRARRWERTADEIEAAALRLFASRGFDGVTVEEVAAAAGISPRTFFRYFPTKESVLERDQQRRTADLHRALAARPDDEPVLEAVRNAFLSMAVAYQRDREQVLAWAKILAGTPRLVSRFLAYPTMFMESVTALVAARLAIEPERDIRPALIARTMLVGSYVAYERWLADGATRDLGVLVGEALDLVVAGLAATVEETAPRRRARRRVHG